ncbi:MAG: N-acetylmuramoyl-L-alanine amidase [Bacteroidales bacterium]|jgi:N-acetylmuramoyl-L-alanine amidase|nr:N-acetylmuramoyl-L-alanine amidase [Bacteroidales bacterium]
MRQIKEIIIHCTATPEGRNHTVGDIDRWHKQKGWDEIGYHFLIDINGEIMQGRNIEKAGIHTVGHNANSIAICYVGGCDKNMRTKDTRTPVQAIAIRKLANDLKIKYPGVKVYGHRDFNATDCPGFDVHTQL